MREDQGISSLIDLILTLNQARDWVWAAFSTWDRTVYQLQPGVLDISIRSSHYRKFILEIRALPF